MFKYIFQNWLLLLPIAALSVASLYFIVERVIYLLRIRERDPEFEKNILLRIAKRKKKLDLLAGELGGQNSPHSAVIAVGLANRHKSVIDMEKHMEARAGHHMILMEKNVRYLSGIANISTLLGLFGTVTGMIVAFMNMDFFGISDPSVLAGGISQALVTTAAGLGVAIPSLLFYHIFSQFINTTASRLEVVTGDFLALMAEIKEEECPAISQKIKEGGAMAKEENDNDLDQILQMETEKEMEAIKKMETEKDKMKEVDKALEEALFEDESEKKDGE